MNTYNKPKDKKSWYTTAELAAFLGVSTLTVKRWRKSGKIEEPAERTPLGWGLWSPDQATAILRWRSRG